MKELKIGAAYRFPERPFPLPLSAFFFIAPFSAPDRERPKTFFPVFFL